MKNLRKLIFEEALLSEGHENRDLLGLAAFFLAFFYGQGAPHHHPTTPHHTAPQRTPFWQFERFANKPLGGMALTGRPTSPLASVAASTPASTLADKC